MYNHSLLRIVNRILVAVLAGVIILAMVSCEKEILPRSGEVEPESLNVSRPLPPPVLMAWFKGPTPPVTDDIPGNVPLGLTYAQGFAINGKGYIFGGITKTDYGQPEYHGYLLQYDTASKTWSQRASNTDGYTGEYAENFVIGNSAYICNGYNDANYQYNQTTNAWKRKALLPSVARALGTGMAIGGKGYIGLGNYLEDNGSNKDAADWWEYDPSTDKWTRKAEFPGGKREGAVGFTINGKGYICTGYNKSAGTYYADLWQYDPVLNKWLPKANYPGAGRDLGAGFSGTSYGYVGGGQNDQNLTDFYGYDPNTNSWFFLPRITGGGRSAAASFTIGKYLYVGCGTSNIDFYYYPYAD